MTKDEKHIKYAFALVAIGCNLEFFTASWTAVPSLLVRFELLLNWLWLKVS
jgi:hypothetical protein